jgi:uroporphyrinogen-III decarboxylase
MEEVMKITNRERFKAIARFQRPGDLFVTEMLSAETLPTWVKQGAPKQMLDEDFGRGGKFFRDYFKLDNKRVASEIKSGWGDWGGSVLQYLTPTITTIDGSPLVPGFERRIIAEDEHTITYIDGTGQTMKVIKGKSFSMPMFLDCPVKDRATWKQLKKKLDPNTPERWPADWKAYVQELNNQDDPVVLQVGGFFGYLRTWIGTERILYMFHDDPGLIEEMMDQLLYLETEIIKRVVKDIRIDEADYWEDIAYKAGPFISPDMVKKYIVPRYKKINELLHSNGIDIIFVDCDGNIEQLIPLWLESGVNYVWPLEQAAGNDAVAYRKKYGKDLILGGAIDKRALLKGKEAIREEVMSKVPFLLEKGGYFPSVDHVVPPGITFENYRYYINTLREVAGLDILL